jgi:hypothetical protein
MLPQTVGELKSLVKDLPDDMPLELDVRSYAAIESASFEVEDRKIGWNGKPIMRKMLVINIRMDD